MESLMDVRLRLLSNSDLCPVTLVESQMSLNLEMLVSLSYKDSGVTKGARNISMVHATTPRTSSEVSQAVAGEKLL